jgi:exopolysaccharide biosynthesis polyprenyl glycosylphosphotransferase
VTPIRHRLSLALVKAFDSAIVIFAFAISALFVVKVHDHSSLSDFLMIRMKVADVLIFALMLLVHHSIFQGFGLYHSRRLSPRHSEITDLLKATALSLSCIVALGVLFSVRMFTVQFLVVFCSTTAIGLLGFRVALRALLVQLRIRGRNLRYMLIFGTNQRAVSFAREVVSNPEWGYRLLGFVDDLWPGMAQFQSSGFTVVADYSGLANFLRQNVVDEAVVYLPFGSFYHHWAEVASLCAHHGITVRLNADTFGLRNARWLPAEIDGRQYIATQTGAAEGWPMAVKRILDVTISVLLLVLLLPLFGLVVIAIKMSSPGPVFFLQERIGLNKRRFRIVKFRTMVPNAESLINNLQNLNEVSGPVFKIKNDPRITPIGKVLRRSSIDELPQLFNVLKGDMSLVGPRPLPLRDYEGFSEDWQRRRFSAKPGITCLWQVGGRSEIPFDQWMLLDLKYLDEWSLWLDIKILLRTLPAVMRGSGAA